MHKSMIFALSLITVGCASTGGSSGLSAKAMLQPTKGSSTSGTVSFIQHDGKVTVTARVAGLKPGWHGIHIHETGDCSAPDGSSAGGHYNPGGAKHGHPHQGEHHAGDLPMLEADAGGNATMTTNLLGVSLHEKGNNIIGRSVIVHAAPDDYVTQPAGNSGARIACGAISR
ncbi:MAG: superoxide dismutase [Rhodocyclales bacterium GWA2_65_20]|nr:MAG: superoxide dismutase [Rhodocyclales bacterium GWA2_65_20]